MRVHFIAIGGAIMHNLAIALKDKGYQVTGSDDVIFDPSKSILQKHGLLPAEFGFFPERITPDIDAIILGMHAKMDNAELTRAMELGLKVYSFPEYIFEQSKDKKRIVIAGSHGKTTITSMIMHVLQKMNYDFDFMVGSSVAGFPNNVKLSNAPIIILEGDEYLTSALQKEPKFIHYKGNIALLSGIAWDHINVFPTFEIYLDQFQKLVNSLDTNAHFIYFNDDEHIAKLVSQKREDLTYIPYETPAYSVINEQSVIEYQGEKFALQVFGKHNLQNIEGARKVCNAIGVSDYDFYNSIKSFSGAGRRLELVRKDDKTIVYRDFAHSPSKLQATVRSVKETYPAKHLIACMELHTFSSLKKDFLPEFKHSMAMADTAIVFVNEETVKQKGSEMLTNEDIQANFDHPNLHYFTDRKALEDFLLKQNRVDKVFLMMSSGNFGGMDLLQFSFRIFDESREIEMSEPGPTNNSNGEAQTFTTDYLSFDELEKRDLNLLHIGGMLTTIVVPIYYFLSSPSNLIKNEARKTFNFQLSLVLIAMLSMIPCCTAFFIIPICISLSVIYSLISIMQVSNNKTCDYPIMVEWMK